jgi:hypothetical protein
MPVMLERWNDDRMDALDTKVDHIAVRLVRVETRVDEGFKRTDAELLEQRREMKAGFQKIDDRFDKLNDRLTHVLVAVMGAGATLAAAIITASLL